jgi:hypothetical protein
MNAMTASTARPVPADPLRLVEAALLGVLFLAGVVALSLPALGGAWLWLLAAPATALATARGLRLRARRAGQPRVRVVTVRRRRARAALAAQRRRPALRQGSRLLAALSLT